MNLEDVNLEDVKAGIRLLLPILEMIAKRTRTTADDSLVVWLHGVADDHPAAKALLG